MKLLDRIKTFLSQGNRYHLLSVMIIFFFAAVVTYANLGLVKSFIGDDAGVIYHFPSTLWNLATSMWDSYNFPGRPNVIASIGLIHIGFINFLHLIGLTSLVIDRLVYFLFFFVSALGMYLLAYNLCSKISNASKSLIWAV
ncbi:MAG: hypothetical protein NTY30_00170, partial [Candidatus Berkelbacteria bacterium]|nr:hypothetical protein [Candidatus Berkelbacteria bacterium]